MNATEEVDLREKSRWAMAEDYSEQEAVADDYYAVWNWYFQLSFFLSFMFLSHTLLIFVELLLCISKIEANLCLDLQRVP